MFKRILVPLDGSSRAEYALPVAAHIARATGSSMHLLRVAALPIDYGGGLAEAPLLMEQMIETEMDVTTSYLKRVAAFPLLKDIQITTEAAFGLPAQYILARAQPGTTDLIVLCSHGRTGFARWALGSVAHTLVHESTIPTLILRENEPASFLSDSDTARPLHTLIPLDGSQLAKYVLDPASYLTAALSAPEQGGALHLAEVVRFYAETADETFISGQNEEALQHARAYLATTREHLLVTQKDLKLTLTYSVEFDTDVASVLVHLAEHGSDGKANTSVACDLIAMSTHGRSGLERWVMGSVTERVLSTTRLPMLIVRPPKNK